MRWPTKRQLRRWWRPFRIVAGFALLGLAAWVITGKTSELSGASAFLTQLRWFWLALGTVSELGSFVALATVQWLLLRAGGVRTRVSRLTTVTFAGSSIQAALPVGAAFAGLYVFRQYELLGADEVLAGWVVIATFTVAFATLATLAGVGLAFAASTGTTFDLVGAIVGVLVFAALVVILWVNRAKTYPFLARGVAALERRLHRPRGQFTGPLARALERMSSVAPARNEWLWALLVGGADWVADCGCLAFAFLAVGSPVPWQGLLLAYCAAQLAVNLPITPGGLGVVEGTLTVALVAFAGGRAPVVAAVLLYRLISFWIPIPIGAGCYVALARGRRRRERELRDAAHDGAAQERPAGPASRGSSAVSLDGGSVTSSDADGRGDNREAGGRRTTSASPGGSPGASPGASSPTTGRTDTGGASPGGSGPGASPGAGGPTASTGGGASPGGSGPGGSPGGGGRTASTGGGAPRAGRKDQR